VTLAASAPAPAVEDALARAGAAEQLTVEDAEALLHARGGALERLLDLASATRDEGLRRAGRPGVITYSRKVFLPVTTLCRDRCHYCIFVDTPGQLLKLGKPAYMSREQVLAVAREGAALDCKEALFTLGDRPEERWPEARAWLDEHGYRSTLHYVADMAQAVLDETGLLPHLNPGVMSREELEYLRPFAPSMGMMLETTSERLFTEKGQVHYGSPDKDPAVRLQVLEDAGAARVPFTTGILVGIGETVRDRAESLIAIRDTHARHGHVQETIVQNFRAKPRTAMQDAPDADLLEYVAAVAVARLVLGPDARVQVPPNLSDPAEFGLLVRAGADDWGGVSPLTADHVNPERPWPHLDELADATAAAGFELRERLTAHAPYLADPATWIDEALAPRVAAMADERGLARGSEVPGTAPVRSAGSARSAGDGRAAGSARSTTIDAILRRAESDPAGLDDAEYAILADARGHDLDRLAAVANDVRRYSVGESVSIVVNRNLDSGRLGEYTLEDAADVARDAVDLGATELCLQGTPPEGASDPLELIRTIAHAAPPLHVHAFRPADIDALAGRHGLSLDAALAALRDAGVGTIPGTGVKILDDRIRERIAPTDLPVDRWTEIVTAAHRAGLRSTSVIVVGHDESAADRVAHLRSLAAIQDSTGGFTELVPMTLPGATADLDVLRSTHAVARLVLHGRIRHLQAAWTRVGPDGAAVLLQSGADDLGGTLLDGRVLPQFGAEAGHELTLDAARRLVAPLFRTLRQRTTAYGDASGRSVG
jgi:FO synthase